MVDLSFGRDLQQVALALDRLALLGRHLAVCRNFRGTLWKTVLLEVDVGHFFSS